MKTPAYYFSILAILPFLSGIFFKADTLKANENNAVEAIDPDDRLNHEYVLTVFLKLKDGEKIDVALAKEYQMVIPKEYNHLVLHDNNLFYDEEGDTDIDFDALEKVTGIREVIKNIGKKYEGKEIASGHYLVYDNTTLFYCSSTNKLEYFEAYLQKCWGAGDGQPFVQRCDLGNKRCSCNAPANMNIYPCYHCFMEPEFNNRCEAISIDLFTN